MCCLTVFRGGQTTHSGVRLELLVSVQRLPLNLTPFVNELADATYKNTSDHILALVHVNDGKWTRFPIQKVIG